jgi:hypothetical protein
MVEEAEDRRALRGSAPGAASTADLKALYRCAG